MVKYKLAGKLTVNVDMERILPGHGASIHSRSQCESVTQQMLGEDTFEIEVKIQRMT